MSNESLKKLPLARLELYPGVKKKEREKERGIKKKRERES